MKHTPKRLFRSAVAAALAVLMLPPIPLMRAADTSDVLYEPTNVGAAVVPGFVAEDAAQRNTYVISQPSMVITERFTKQNASYTKIGGSNPNTLNTSLSFKHTENKKWNIQYRWDIPNGSALEELMRDSQISVGIQADLTGDKHSNAGNHAAKKFDRAQAYVTAGMVQFDRRTPSAQTTGYIINAGNDGDGVARTHYGCGDIGIGRYDVENPYVDYRQYVDYLEFFAGATDCSCGSSAVAKPYIFLVDNKAPKVKSVYPSDADGNVYGYHHDNRKFEYYGEDLRVSKGETGYFAIEFTEYIRLADHMGHDLQMTLDVFNTQNGQVDSSVSVTATLYKVTDTKLVFSFLAPENGTYTIDQINPQNASYTYNGKEVNWIKADNTFDLLLLNNSGNAMEYSGKKVSSIVTDLAGNPVEWEMDKIFYMDKRIYTDTVAPQAISQWVGGSMISSDTNYSQVTGNGNWPADIDRSSVFAATGDTVKFTVEFDEEIGTLVPIAGFLRDYETLFLMSKSQMYKADEKAFTTVGGVYHFNYNPAWAVTNILDKDGNNVTVSASHWSSYYAAPVVDSSKVHTHMAFETLTIQDGYTTENGESVRIKSVHFQNYNVTDASGNPVGTGRSVEVAAIPANQIYLDVTKPEVTFGDTMAAQDSSTGRGVATIPFTIRDVAGTGERFASGVTGLQAMVMVDAYRSDEYAISDTPAIEGLQWQDIADTALTVPVVEGVQKYLHLRFSDKYHWIDPETGFVKDVTATVQVTDYAGMTANVTNAVDGIQIDFNKPVVEVSDAIYLDANDALAVKVNISDESNLKKVTYTWTTAEGSSDPVEITEFGSKATKYALDAVGGPSTGSGTASLTVVAEDVLGNREEVTKTYSYNRDTALPGYEVGSEYGSLTDAPVLKVLYPVSQDTASYTTVVFVTVGDTTYEFQLNSFDSSEPGSAIENIFVHTAASYQYSAEEIAFDDAAKTIVATTTGGYMNNFAEAVASYNGTIPVRIVNMPRDIVHTKPYNLTAGENQVSDLVKLEFQVCTSPSATVSIGTPKDPSGAEVDYFGYPADSTTPVLCTLTGLAIPIALDASTMEFGLDVIDFENSYAVLTDENGNELEDTKVLLEKTDLQTYVVSKPLSGHTAKYGFKVVVQCLCGTWETATDSLSLYMDDTPYSDIYPAAYNNHYQLGANGTALTPTYGEELSENVTVVNVGSTFASNLEGSQKTATTFTFKTSRDDESLAAFPEVMGKNIAIKVYNNADPNGKRNAQYSHSSDFAVEFVDAFPEVYQEDTIYVLRDSTVSQDLVYSTQMQNGEISSERSVKLNVLCNEIDFSVTYTTIDNDVNSAKATLTALNSYTQQLLDTDTYSLYLLYYVKDEAGTGTVNKIVQVNPDAGNGWYLSGLNTSGEVMGYEGYFMIDSHWNFSGVDKVRDPASADYFDLDMPALQEVDFDGTLINDFDTLRNNMKAILYDPAGTIDMDSMKITYYHLVDGERVNPVQWPVTFSHEFEPKQADGSNRNDPEPVEGGMQSLNEQIQVNNGVVSALAYHATNPAIAPFSFGEPTYIRIESVPPRELVTGEQIYAEFSVADTAGRVSTVSDLPVVTDYMPDEMICISSDVTDIVWEGQEGYRPTLMTHFPTRIISPARLAESEFALHHDVPIFIPGTYELTCEDIWGNIVTYSVDIPGNGTDPDGFFFRLQGEVIENGPNEPVTVNAWENSDQLILKIVFVDKDGKETVGTVSEDRKTATIQAYENGIVRVTAERNRDYYSTGDHFIEIPVVASAIPDTAVEPVTVTFFDSQGNPISADDAATREDFVTVQLDCEEELVALDGDLTHTFRAPASKGATHTFRYADLADNTGAITVTLPCDIVQSQEPVEDTQVPVFTVRAYTMTGSSYKQVGLTYESDQTEGELAISNLPAVFSDPGFAMTQKYRLALSITDASAAKVVVKTQETASVTYATQSDTVDGLTVTERTVSYEGTTPQTLYLYVVDAADNAVALPALNFPAVDTIPPTATTVDVLDEYAARLYLIPDDPANTIVYDTHLLVLETEGEYAGYYYLICEKNGTYYFRIADAAGNISNIEGVVDCIPTSSMELVSMEFIVGGQTYSRMEDIPNTINNVRVLMTFNQNIAMYDDTGMGFDEWDRQSVKTQVFMNRLAMTFDPYYYPSVDPNTGAYPETSVLVYAPNGDRVEVVIPPITCLDYGVTGNDVVAERVLVNGTEISLDEFDWNIFLYLEKGDKVEAYFRVAPDIVYSDQATPMANDPTLFYGVFEAQPESSGGGTVHFYDTVGNDNEFYLYALYPDPLTMRFATDDQGTNATNMPNTLGLQAGQTIYVQPSISSTIITCGDMEVIGYCDEWVAVTIPTAGDMCFISGYVEPDDWYGWPERTVNYYLSYAPGDTTAPEIYLQRDRVVLPVGLTAQEIQELLLAGVSVRDNICQASEITVTVDISQVQPDVAGCYRVTYQATDASGNQAEAVQQDLVLSSNPVQVQIDNTPVVAFDTVLLDQGSHVLKLEAEASQPFYVAIKAGYKTEAQMKTGSTVLVRNEAVTQVELKDLKPGIHTLYIRTQERESFVIYLSVS